MPKIRLLPDLTGPVAVLFSTHFPDGIPVLDLIEFQDSVKESYLKEMPELTPDDCKAFAFDWSVVFAKESLRELLLREFGKIVNSDNLKVDELIENGRPCFAGWDVAEILGDK